MEPENKIKALQEILIALIAQHESHQAEIDRLLKLAEELLLSDE